MDGNIWVQMGVDGVLLMRWGLEARVHNKTREAGGIYGRKGHDLGPMAGEISPNIMFCKKKLKQVGMAPDGCKCVRMSSVGCICTRGQENKGKRGKNQRSGHVLQL